MVNRISYIFGGPMRYHHKKPAIYLSMYGKIYICEHHAYNKCTLFKIDNKGLAVIQKRFIHRTKYTWWGEFDPWLTDSLYLHPNFKNSLTNELKNLQMIYIPRLQLYKLCGLLK